MNGMTGAELAAIIIAVGGSLATVLASVSALIVALRTKKIVNGRMDEFKADAKALYTAEATLAEKAAQSRREGVAAITLASSTRRADDAPADVLLLQAADAARVVLDEAATVASQLIADARQAVLDLQQQTEKATL